jgi:hypothetical protein
VDERRLTGPWAVESEGGAVPHGGANGQRGGARVPTGGGQCGWRGVATWADRTGEGEGGLMVGHGHSAGRRH